MMLINAVELFPEPERERVRVASQRYAVAMEDVDQIMEEHAKQVLGSNKLSRWGPPDTALNALAMIGHALSTPGHYGRAPILTGAPSSVVDMMAPLWCKEQHVEYLTYCLGSMAVLVDVDGSGGVAFHAVPPHHLWATASEGDPSTPVIMRRLVIRDGKYCWDVWDVSDPADPKFYTCKAERNGEMGDTLRMDADYAWRDADGLGVMPWAIHRTWDTGDLWCWQRGRSVARGTVQGMVYWSAAGRAAINSTGKVAVVINAVPIGIETVDHGSGAVSMTVDVDPGDILFLTSEPGNQPVVSEIGEVETLPALAAFAAQYTAVVQTATGITPTDAVRASANPMSGSAIYLSNDQKREEQRRTNVLRRAADSHILAVACRLVGADPAGIGIVYYEIGRSPDEERQQREADEWERAQGLISQVDLMMRRRPGLTREEAVAELRRVRAEEAEINGGAT